MVLNPATFPRPPLLDRVSRHLVVKWPSGQVIADTTRGYWVLETHHPPTYYIPQSDIKVDLKKTSRSTYCEWKGRATYFTVPAPLDGSSKAVDNRAWCYESPTPGFKDIKDYVSFYTGPWDYYVNGEKAQAQPGYALLRSIEYVGTYPLTFRTATSMVVKSPRRLLDRSRADLAPWAGNCGVVC